MRSISINRQTLRDSGNVIKRGLSYFYAHFIKFPLYILTHPIDGFYEMKHESRGLLRVATFYLFLHSILGILEFNYTGFLFNTLNPNTFRMFRSIVVALMPYLIFVVANWSITSLMDGKGKFKEIYMVVGYAFFPSVILRIANLFFSNYFTLDEAFFYYGIETVGFILTIIMIFMGIRSIHEYSVLRAVSTVFLSILSMLVIVFIGLLALGLAQQIAVFVETIIKEITLRL
ncbi:MAG: DUF1282 domain-containing protein [Acholeplasma sp.]|jgi:hypothetical protein|nr:MAG: DUF1282 domain-containing protein [Acholeplasma sp.]